MIAFKCEESVNRHSHRSWIMGSWIGNDVRETRQIVGHNSR
jgi:hypothetical protein